MRKLNDFIFIFRILIGLLLVVSGIEKIISPYQNFLYVIQSYEVLPATILEELTAHLMPWFELFIGIFLILGLWLPLSLRGALGLFLTFIIVVGQAIVRKLPVGECGCFGGLISFPLEVIILMDSFSLVVLAVLLLKISSTSRFSLDQYFSSGR